MYSKGDIVAHGHYGLCRVTDVRKMSFGRKPKEKYLILVPLYEPENTLYIPASTAETVLRKPLTQEQIYRLIQEMPNMDSIWIDDMKRRKDTYAAIIQKGDPIDLIHLIRTIHTKGKEKEALGKRLSDADEKSLRVAEQALNGELAYGLGVDPSEVPELIERQLNKE